MLLDWGLLPLLGRNCLFLELVADLRVLELERLRGDDTRLAGSVLALLQLLTVHVVVHLLESPGFLNLVEIDHETSLLVVDVFDALAAEDAWVVAAVEVLDPLIMQMTQVRLQVLRVLLVIDV